MADVSLAGYQARYVAATTYHNLTVDLYVLFLLIRIDTLLTPSPSSSDPLARDIEAVRNRNHSRSQEPENANTP